MEDSFEDAKELKFQIKQYEECEKSIVKETRAEIVAMMAEIVKERPLASEYETDARNVWPNRWDELKDRIERKGCTEETHGIKFLAGYKICPDCHKSIERKGNRDE